MLKIGFRIFLLSTTAFTLTTALSLTNADQASGQISANYSANTIKPTKTKYVCNTETLRPIWAEFLTALKLSSDTINEGDKANFHIDVNSCEEELKIEEYDLNGDGIKEVLAKMWGLGLCSARGNCPIAIFERTNESSSSIRPIFFTEHMMAWEVKKRKTHKYQDVIFRFNTAGEFYLELYRFDGRLYKRTKCFEQYKDDSAGKRVKTDCWEN